MSDKIDELQAKISACYRNRQVLIKAFDDEVQKYEKEIARLEAESARPREWIMYLTDTGQLSGSAAYLGGPFGKMKQFQPITVREVKPLVITRDDSYKAWRVWQACQGRPDDHYECFMQMLNAAGIEAIPEGGK